MIKFVCKKLNLFAWLAYRVIVSLFVSIMLLHWSYLPYASGLLLTANTWIEYIKTDWETDWRAWRFEYALRYYVSKRINANTRIHGYCFDSRSDCPKTIPEKIYDNSIFRNRTTISSCIWNICIRISRSVKTVFGFKVVRLLQFRKITRVNLSKSPYLRSVNTLR